MVAGAGEEGGEDRSAIRMSDRIKKADAALFDDDILEIVERVYGDSEPSDLRTETIVLSDLLIRISAYLAKRAEDGDRTSFDQLFYIATNSARHYERILTANQEALRRHAVHHEEIPLLVGRSPDSVEKAEKLVKQTGVGDRIGLASKGRQKDSVFREIAEELIRELLDEITRLSNVTGETPFSLPPLSRDPAVVKVWWPHVLKRFKGKYGPEIENHPRFASWRKSRSDRYNPSGRTDSALRADLNVRLKQALEHIAGLRDERGRLLQ